MEVPPELGLSSNSEMLGLRGQYLPWNSSEAVIQTPLALSKGRRCQTADWQYLSTVRARQPFLAPADLGIHQSC